MKKLVCLLMVGTVALGFLAGCAAGGEPAVTVLPGEQVVVTATPAPATPEPEKPTGHILLWGWTAAIRDVVEAVGLVEAFNEEYPDIEVEIVYQSPSDVYTNLPLAITAGEGAPDVCLVENSHVAEIVHMGGLLDLTEQLAPYMDNLVEYKLYDCEMDGRYYCMPWDGGPVVMYYRRDVFEAAGLPTDPTEVTDTIATWADYLVACETIKAETGNYCFSNNKANNYGRLYEMMLWEQGLGYYDPATGEVTVDSPENIATLELMGQFWDADVTSDALEWTDVWYEELAATESPGIIATIVEASWMDIFLKSWIAPGTAGKWGVARMPSVTGDGPRAANDGGSVFVVPEQTQNPEAAWAFVEFVLGRDESVLDMFAVSGFIPSLKSAYDSPLFLAGDSFFAGQNVNAIYAEVNQAIPQAGIYGPDKSMMSGSVSLAIQLYATGEMSAADALAQAADEIRANLD